MFEINDEFSAYFIGLIQSDGFLSRKRVGIELNYIDRSILEQIQERLGGKIIDRSRRTNFSDCSELSEWRLNSVEFVKCLNHIGISCGKKSKIALPIPVKNELEFHYVRGLIDGDGSLCISSQSIPIIGFTTASTAMRDYFSEYLNKLGIQSQPNRNKRDNIYNFCVQLEKAQILAQNIYGNSTIFLPRKFKIYQQIMSWKRPENMIKRNWENVTWSEDEIQAIQECGCDPSKSLAHPALSGRTKNSIKTKCWRLKTTNT